MQADEICPFQIRSASDAEYACLNEFKNVLRLEVLPEDPPIGLAEDVERWHSMPEYLQQATWVARENGAGRVIAFAEAEIHQTGDNPHLMSFDIQVLPEFRQRGLARQMLRLIVDHAQSNNRRLMITETHQRVPAGAAFLSGMGGRKGIEAHLNQLRFAELDRSLIRRWIKQSSALSSEFRLGWWEDRCPEDRLQELADLFQVVANDEPRDVLEMEDRNYSPELLRQFETLMLAGGKHRRVLYIADCEHDRLVGFTEVLWHPDRGTLLLQEFTGVLPQYRGRGLGRWLKAEMLSRVLRECPQAEVIRTGNADSNAAMLKVNTQLGYRPYASVCVWQVDTDVAEQYLAARD